VSLALGAGLVLLGVAFTWAADRLADVLVGDRARPARREWLLGAGTAAALASLAAGTVYGLTPALAAALAVTAALTAVTVVDLRSSLIPDRLLLGAALITAPPAAWSGLSAPVDMTLGALVCGGVMLAAALAAGSGLGGGDVKFSIYIGLVLGWQRGVAALMLGVLLGGLAGAVALATRRRGPRDAMAYGPYLAAGAALALLWGDALVRWYRGL